MQAPALQQPTPVMALAVSGMNDVLNSQGYTQAAWWYRIPTSAWALVIVTAIGCNVLIGYGVRGDRGRAMLLTAFPVIVSISFLLIADIDAPRGGTDPRQAAESRSLGRLHAEAIGRSPPSLA